MSEFASFHDLAGASVFITGGGSGIGAALTEGFLRQGANVAFVQRSDASDFVAQAEAQTGRAPLFLPCDIADGDALRSAIVQAEQTNGPIRILVNNAANDTRHTLDEFSDDDWNKAMDVNLRPHFITAQAVHAGMRDIGKGSIINFSSISYMMGNAGYPAYATAKAAITGLTRVLARELGPDKIRVNTLVPGWVLTERQQNLWATPKALQNQLDRQCLKEHLAERDIVDAALFLASDASRMMTGQALVIDGGVV